MTKNGAPVNNRLYLDLHIVQTVPPANLNRDDTGSPKQAQYGGVRRARVSSQSWKRATRRAFVDQVDQARLATRTRRLPGLLAGALTAQHPQLDAEAAQRLAAAAVNETGIGVGKKATDTAVLLFIGRQHVSRLAGLLGEQADELAGLDDKALAAAVKGMPIREILFTAHPLDVALFGRMVAEVPGVNVDAAVQVAHALSTHAVELEFDYFTAVDDENTRADTGAGMIGTVEFNSATLYRYANLGLHLLRENLADDPAAVEEAVRAFVTCWSTSMPSGHANSFAQHTMPHAVIAVLRPDQPINLVTAYEDPVRGHGHGFAGESVQRLAAELQQMTTQWGLPAGQVVGCYSPDQADQDILTSAFGAPVSFPDLVEQVVQGTGQSR